MLPAPSTPRLPALDWLRGLVMAVMTVDHADSVFNRHHMRGDAAGWQPPGPLPAGDFLTRWCTHLCAPTFFCLAGAGIALSVAHARAAARDGLRVDLHLVLRAVVLVLFEVFWIGSAFPWMQGGGLHGFRQPVLQVLYALGAGMAAMALLRRLPSWALLGLAVALLAGSEAACTALRGEDVEGSWTAMAFLGGGAGNGWFVLYPALPWLPAMLLGFLLGRRLAVGKACGRWLLFWGTAALLLFLLVRGVDGYGNMGLHRRDGSLLEWLHCSKYPPSASFLLLELGLMAWLLAGCLWWQGKGRAVATWNPLLVLGQVPLFFYLLHLWAIGVWLRLGLFHRGSPWWMSWIAAAATVLVLWPLCGAYRCYKQTWRHGWTRYV